MVQGFFHSIWSQNSSLGLSKQKCQEKYWWQSGQVTNQTYQQLIQTESDFAQLKSLWILFFSGLVPAEEVRLELSIALVLALYKFQILEVPHLMYY